MYHDVIPVGDDKQSSGLNIKGADAYKISEKAFEAHVGTASEIRDKTGQEIVFTFDDGGKSAILVIAPILDKFNFKGIFFIPSSFIGLPGFLSEDDILNLSQRGHIIGSHSHFHRLMMNRLPYHDILAEWKMSDEKLSRIVKASIEHASVPGGWYAPIVAKAASETGIAHLYTSKPIVTQQNEAYLMVYGRFAIKENMSSQFVKSIMEGKNFARQWMLFMYNIGQVVKSFY